MWYNGRMKRVDASDSSKTLVNFLLHVNDLGVPCDSMIALSFQTEKKGKPIFMVYRTSGQHVSLIITIPP